MVGRRRATGLIVLASAALALRVWAVFVLRTEHAGPISYEHGRIAENLLAGKGFSIEFLGREGPTSQQAPFYPLLLAAFYWCFGTASPAAVLAVQLLQCVAGTGLVLAVVWLGWLLVPDRPAVGWTAGVGAALYPPHIYAVTHLQVALWAALGLTVLLAICLSPRWRGGVRGAVLAGLCGGLLLLIEPIMALALPVCCLVSWREAARRTAAGWWRAGAVRCPAILAGTALLVITPWTIRNLRVHGQLIFIKSTLGYAFWQGNNPISWGTDKVPKPSADALRRAHDGTLAGMNRAVWEARHETLYIDDVLLKPGGYREFAGLSEVERCRLLGRRAWKFVRTHPGHYWRLCLQRLRFFLLFDQTNPKAAVWLYRASTVVWLVLAVVGLLSCLDRWRALWPTYVIFAAVTLFHTLVIVSPRFRIPIEPLSLVWAGAAVAPLVERLFPEQRIKIYRPGERSHRGDRRAAPSGPHWRQRHRRVA